MRGLTQRLLHLVLLFCLCAPAFAVTPTPDTPTQTPSSTPTDTPTPLSTNTPTFTATPTINVTLQSLGKPLTERRRQLLNSFSPACKQADCAELSALGVRQVRIPATNATPLGLADVSTVTSILAFVASSGAPATQTLLQEPTDYTVGGGDVTPVGDHSSELWVITYRP